MAGQQTFKLQGTIIDSSTQESLANVHIIKNDSTGLITDQCGNFAVCVKPKDSLFISHIGYEAETIHLTSFIEDTTYKISIALKPKSYNINKVMVQPYGNYSKFKHAFLNLNTKGRISDYVTENIERMNHKSYSDYDYPDVYKGEFGTQVTGPPQIILFSTNKKKGIYKFIRALFNNNSEK
jgi:hypothetical protein